MAEAGFYAEVSGRHLTHMQTLQYDSDSIHSVEVPFVPIAATHMNWGKFTIPQPGIALRTPSLSDEELTQIEHYVDPEAEIASRKQEIEKFVNQIKENKILMRLGHEELQ